MLLGLCALIYFLDGLIHSILGPLAPDMARSLALGSAELGPVFSSNLLGQCIGLVIFPLFAGRYGQRAIVVDWKSTPMVPGELVEWHRRLSDVCGRRVESRRDLRGYNELARSELDRLKTRYHLNYDVVSRGNELIREFQSQNS